MNRLEGCRIEMLDNQACQAILGRVTGSEESEFGVNTFSWLLAHCHDGVTWGRYESSNRCWQLSSNTFPDLSPKISSFNLLEIRLFGPESEIMFWKTERGLSGRCIIDRPIEDDNSPVRPGAEVRILLGDRTIGTPRAGFTRVGTAGGMEQAVPLVCTEDDFKYGYWPLRLRVQHYFELDKETGAVRVAATRLVEVFKEVR
ncbi:MAG: CRISPR-associated protein Csx19 [bacterium]|nr:CRISPR-associated protein Csx19 [bacterium]